MTDGSPPDADLEGVQLSAEWSRNFFLNSLAPLLEGLQAPSPGLPATPTVDDLARACESLRIRSPRAARLEVGVLALDLLHESVPKDQPCGRPGLAAIWGVPIVPSATLAAGAWRMLDADGEEIAAGDLLCPVPRRTETGETGAMDDDPQPTEPEPTEPTAAPTFSGSAPWGTFAISGKWSDPEGESDQPKETT